MKDERVLLLGGYGLIGSTIGRDLIRNGFEVVALGRDLEQAELALPSAKWIIRDLAMMTDARDWLDSLRGVRAIVNASGLLQNSARDDVQAVQTEAIVALVEAAQQSGVERFIQISAPGAADAARTDFMRTKSIADGALRASALNWTIFKPGLVIAPAAYGGSAALRALAAVPYVQPILFAQSQIQTVSVHEVAQTVRAALREPIYDRMELDLVESEPRSLLDTVLVLREWMGLPKPHLIVRIPRLFGRVLVCGADLAGVLGWRNPLRSAAASVLEDNVLGDPEPWRAINGRHMQSLDEILLDMPSTRQERRFARTQLLFPVIVICVGCFWLISGIVGIWQIDNAAAHISDSMPTSAAQLAVLGGSLFDILIGIGLFLRRYFSQACMAGLLLCLVYLVMGIALTPELLQDPLGPLVKILPVAGLMGLLLAIGEPR